MPCADDMVRRAGVHHLPAVVRPPEEWMTLHSKKWQVTVAVCWRLATRTLASACCVALPAAAAGQTNSVTGLTEREEIVVWGQRDAGAPGTAATTVSARDAEEAQATDVGELLQASVPGVAGQRLGAVNTDPVLRGARAERVPVTVDGALVHGACPSRMDPETSLVDMTAVETIDIMKGPYSVTAGPPGVGGSIQIRTKDPEFAPSLTAHGTVGAGYTSNADGWHTEGSVSLARPNLAARLSGGVRDFGDYSSGNGELVPSSFRDRTIGGTALWQPTQDDRLRLDTNVDATRDAHFASANMDTAEEDAYLGTLHYSRRNPFQAIETLTTTGYANYIYHRMDNSDKPNAGTIRMWAPLHASTFGGRVQADLTPLGDARLTVGGDTSYVEHGGKRNMTQLMGPMAGKTMTSTVWPDPHTLDGGMFAEATYPLAPHWRAVLGARIDFIDAGAHPDSAARLAFQRYYGPGAADTDAFETNASANGRLVYSPVDAIDLFAAIGRAVRTASTTERFYVFGPGLGGYLVGNPTLDPERSLEADVGASGYWHGVTLRGSVFYNRVEDYIAPVLLARTDVNMDGTVDIVRGFRNVDTAVLAGVDGGATITVTDRLSVFGSIAYVYGQNQSDHQPLPEIPPLEGTVGLRLSQSGVGNWHAWVTPRVRLVDRQDRINPAFGEDPSAGFATVELLSGLRIHDRYELILNVTNLLDTNYHEHLTRENPFTGAEVPDPGREVSVALRISF